MTSDIDRAELRRLLGEAPPLPWRYREHGSPGDGPTSVALEAKPFKVGWEAIAVGDYDKWSGYGVALAIAAVNALPGLLDALQEAEGHRDSLAATLIEVQREKLALERAIERVRALHVRTDEWCARHEDTLCGCFEACCYECEVLWPCPTIQALDGVGWHE